MTDKEKSILQAELYKLSPTAQEILKKFLEPLDTPIQNTLSVTAAKTFLAEQTSLPIYALSADKDLIEKLNAAVHVLRQELGVWMSLNDLPHEIWCDIENYAGLYQVSNYGRVKSFHKGKIIIRKLVTLSDGYQQVSLDKGGKRKCKNVHALVAQAFLPNLENKPIIDHHDRNTANNCVWNLNWVTNSENQRRAVELGTKRCGCDNPRSDMVPREIREIRRLYVKGSHEFGLIALAKKFGKDKSTIGRIVRKISYKNVI